MKHCFILVRYDDDDDDDNNNNNNNLCLVLTILGSTFRLTPGYLMLSDRA